MLTKQSVLLEKKENVDAIPCFRSEILWENHANSNNIPTEDVSSKH